jgi:hypothetical protein
VEIVQEQEVLCRFMGVACWKRDRSAHCSRFSMQTVREWKKESLSRTLPILKKRCPATFLRAGKPLLSAYIRWEEKRETAHLVW